MNRSFTARLSIHTPRRLRDYLWATHRLFNESLAYLLKHYFWMQNNQSRDADQNRDREGAVFPDDGVGHPANPVKSEGLP